MKKRAALTLLAAVLAVPIGCKRTASTDAPSSGAPADGGAPPSATTTQSPSTRPAAPSRAVAEPARGGPVIIDGTGAGSPGTR